MNAKPVFDHRTAPETFTAVSINTTGAESYDRIIEIGMVRVEKGAKVSEFSTLCNPARSISSEFILRHSISEEHLTDQPSVSDALAKAVQFEATGALIYHSSDLTKAFFEKALAMSPLNLKSKWMDLLAAARGALLDESLVSIADTQNSLEVAKERPAERALDKAHILCECYLALRPLLWSNVSEKN